MRTLSEPRCARLLRLSLVACAVLLAPAASAADPLEDYRERFQQGLDRYRAGDVAGAVRYWEAIRRELGDRVAYRLLYNLGKAYESLGDTTLAVERYEAFLEQLEAQPEGEVEAAVLDNAEKARERIEDLERTRGRIRILPSERPGLVEVDRGEARLGPFRAYVAPGAHTVTIDRGTTMERTIELTLEAGEEAVVDPTRPAPEPAPAPTPSVVLPAAPATSAPPVEPPPRQPPAEPERPFPGYVLAVGTGVSLASFALPVLAYSHADGIADEYEAPSTSVARRRQLADDYDAAKTLYNVSWLAPALLTTATGALTVWYLQGGTPPSREAGVQLEAGAMPGGGGMELRGRF